jgi:CheY-like chemotaxis protein
MLADAAHLPFTGQQPAQLIQSQILMAKRILFICYEPEVLRERKLVLEDAGYQVTGSTKDAEVLHLLTQQKFDLIIVGDKMPTHKRTELDRKAKKLRPATPVIVFMNDPKAPDGEADAIVTHPENPHALLEKVLEFVGKHSGA